jgi:hypothetical protein
MWKNKIKKAKLAEPGSSSPEPSDVADIDGNIGDSEKRSESAGDNADSNGSSKRQRGVSSDSMHEGTSGGDDHSTDRVSKRTRSGTRQEDDTSPMTSNRKDTDQDIMQSPEGSIRFDRGGVRPSKRDQNWDTQYEALLAFANKHKHCNIRTGYSADGDDKPQVNLYAWLALQRRHKKQNKLRSDREQKLQALVDSGLLSWTGADVSGRGLDEDEYIQVLPPPPPPSWENHFGEILVFSELYGHANVPLGYRVTIEKRKDIDLGFWLEEQRKMNSKNILDNPIHVAKLNTLAKEGRFRWDVGTGAASTAALPAEGISGSSRDETRQLTNAALVVTKEAQQSLDAKWNGRYQAMLKFISRDENRTVCVGDEILATLVATVCKEGGAEVEESFDLGLWVHAQRKSYAAESLVKSRQELLQALVNEERFAWLSQEEAARMAIAEEKRQKEEDALWTAWYNALVWHGVNKGHCNINSQGTITLPDGSEAELGKWLHIQRLSIKKGKLRVDRVRKIKKLYDEGKLDPSKWAHVFYLQYPLGSFGDILVPANMVSASVSKQSSGTAGRSV